MGQVRVPPLGGGDGHRGGMDTGGGGEGTTSQLRRTLSFSPVCPYMGFLHAAEFGAVGDMGCIRLKKENSWCTSRGCRVQNLGLWVTWVASD